MTVRPPEGTPKADVYSFGIICQEIVYRSGVFHFENMDYTPQGERFCLCVGGGGGYFVFLCVRMCACVCVCLSVCLSMNILIKFLLSVVVSMYFADIS